MSGSAVQSEFIKWAQTFDAVEFFSFPVDGEFEDFQAIGCSCQQDSLGVSLEVSRRRFEKLFAQVSDVGGEFVRDFALRKSEALRFGRLGGKSLQTLGQLGGGNHNWNLAQIGLPSASRSRAGVRVVRGGFPVPFLRAWRVSLAGWIGNESANWSRLGHESDSPVRARLLRNVIV